MTSEAPSDTTSDFDRAELEGLLGDGPQPFPSQRTREFQPWHKPRKHFVRRAQWAREMQFLVRDLKLSGREFRYMTLPGSDLLDIRHIIRTVCIDNDVRLRYLGFNTGAMPSGAEQSGQNVAEFSVKRHPLVDFESQVFPGDFRLVAALSSLPRRYMREQGPFHTVNLDLCNGFAGSEKSTHGIPNYFSALLAVLNEQSRSSEEFLLFVTTRMDDANVDVGAQARLTAIGEGIATACDVYATAFRAAWGLPDSASLTDMQGALTSSEAFMLGLTQWIVSNAVKTGLRASVKSFMTYRVHPTADSDDIVSLAIRFKPDPIPLHDSHGLASPVEVPDFEAQECEQSANIPSRVRSRQLVDQILADHADEFERCVLESSELLAEAGYDRDAYRAWAEAT